MGLIRLRKAWLTQSCAWLAPMRPGPISAIGFAMNTIELAPSEIGLSVLGRQLARPSSRRFGLDGSLGRLSVRCLCRHSLWRKHKGRIEFHHAFGYEVENWLKGVWLCNGCHGPQGVVDGFREAEHFRSELFQVRGREDAVDSRSRGTC